jgi:hypothetical protein
MLSVIKLSVVFYLCWNECHNTDCHYDECHYAVIIQSVIMLLIFRVSLCWLSWRHWESISSLYLSTISMVWNKLTKIGNSDEIFKSRKTFTKNGLKSIRNFKSERASLKMRYVMISCNNLGWLLIFVPTKHSLL